MKDRVFLSDLDLWMLIVRLGLLPSRDDFPPFVTGSFNTLIKHAMDTAAIPGSIPPVLQAGPSRRPNEAPQNQQVHRAAESYHSFASVNAAKERIAVVASDFQPFTHSGVPITKGSNHEDPEVVHGLLESIILDSHREFFCSRPDDPTSLISSGVKSVFMGISDIVRAKSKNDDSLSHAKDQVLIMKKQLAAAEEEVKKQQLISQNLQSALDLASHTASDEVERKFAAFRGESDRITKGLRRNLVEAEKKMLASIDQLSSAKAENSNLRNDLNASREYNSGLEKRHSALMILLSRLRFRYEEIGSEYVGLQETNKALHKRVVDLHGVRDRNALLQEEVENLQKCCTQYSQTLTKLIAESGRTAPIPVDAPPTDPRRMLMEAWHAEEARLRSTIADLEVGIPSKLLERFKEIEDDCVDNALMLSSDSYNDGFSDGYNNGRARALANSSPNPKLSAEIDSQLDWIIKMMTEKDEVRIGKSVEVLKLARTISDMGSEFLFFKNK